VDAGGASSPNASVSDPVLAMMIEVWQKRCQADLSSLARAQIQLNDSRSADKG
jgi:hypothetical protein